jgi:hypothetical protein
MASFAVIGSNNPAVLKAAIVKQYGANHYEFASNVWFVSDLGTTKDVMDKLGITDGKLGASAAVLKFVGYAGYAAGDAWTWLAKNSDAAVHG